MATPAGAPGGSGGPGGTPSATGPSGPTGAPIAPRSPPIAADQIYCSTAQRFTADLRTPPVIVLLSKALRAGTRAGVQISLSKISSVTMTVRQGGRVVWTNGATLERGRPRLLWVTPRTGGSYSLTLSATDPAGNFATASGMISLTKAPKAH